MKSRLLRKSNEQIATVMHVIRRLPTNEGPDVHTFLDFPDKSRDEGLQIEADDFQARASSELLHERSINWL